VVGDGDIVGMKDGEGLGLGEEVGAAVGADGEVLGAGEGLSVEVGLMVGS